MLLKKNVIGVPVMDVYVAAKVFIVKSASW